MQTYTFKSKVTKTEEVEQTVTLPYFCKEGKDNFYAVLSKNEIIRATVSEYGFTALVRFEGIPSDVAKGEPIDQDVFNSAFAVALGRINSFTLPVREYEAEKEVAA